MEPSYSTYMNPFNPRLPHTPIAYSGQGQMLMPYDQNVTTMFQDDGIWLISCSFSIWTMVSGFGLLESGRVSSKDEVNIMVKNVVDVVFGGLSYWMFGFGFTFGTDYPNPYIGIGYFFYDPEKDGQPSDQAWHYARFFFQMSFATTTSTIVSAAMAERIRLKPYIVITYLMTIVHSITAHWVWSEDGFLYNLGVVDAAGCSVVHLVGGVAGLASTLYLKPRQARFGERGSAHMSNPTNALLGTFMLWWGWLAFNTGSTLGVANNRWRLAARSAMVTLLSSIGGGCTAIIISLISTRKCQIDLLIDGLLASLVATTAGCHSFRPFDSLAVGAIGAALALSIYPLVERLEIDDPVGVIPVHVVGATWGMLCVGIFSREDAETIYSDPRHQGVTKSKNGLLYSGQFDLLLVQALCVVIIFVFSLVVTFLSLVIMNQFPWGLRMTKYEEQLGADLIEHGLAGHNITKYSIEKKLNVNVIKYVAKWKRLARKARERRIAEAAAARGEDPETAVAERQVQADQASSGSLLRLGPLKLGTLRRPSHMLSSGRAAADGGGRLTARPKSGRRLPIEKENPSLPPMHSARFQAQKKTSLDLLDPETLVNGVIPGNGSIPLGRPRTVITPSSPTPNSHQNRTTPPLERDGAGVAEEPQRQPNPIERNTGRVQGNGAGGGIIGRLRRGGRVSPRREEIPLQELNEHGTPQRHPQQPHSPRLPPLSAHSSASGHTGQGGVGEEHQPAATPTIAIVEHHGATEGRASERERGGTDNAHQQNPPSSPKHNPNDSIV